MIAYDNLFRTVVIDKSPVMLDVILRVTMRKSMAEYLSDVYNSEVNGSTRKPEVTVLYCCSQYLSALNAEITKIVKKSELRPFYRSALVQIVSGDTFELVDERVNSLLNVLLTPRYTESLQIDFNMLSNFEDCEEIIQDDLRFSDIEKIQLDEDEIENNIRASRFYSRYYSMAQNIKNQKINPGSPVNKYFNRRLADMLVTEHLPYLPLWTSFMSPTGKRLSNSLVRDSFKTFMRDWMESDTHKKPEKVADALKSRSKVMIEKMFHEKGYPDLMMQWS